MVANITSGEKKQRKKTQFRRKKLGLVVIMGAAPVKMLNRTGATTDPWGHH